MQAADWQTNGEPATPEKSREALRAAQLYYLQDLTMDAIASELRTSRSSVSRLLSYARQHGLVEIRVVSPLDKLSVLQHDIAERFRVNAHVVPVPEATSDIDRLERVAISAARILTPFFDSNMILGVAWGATINAVSRHLPRKETHNSRIVQLNGAGNTSTTGIDYASEILRRFGKAFDAPVQQFPVPAFFDDPRTKEAMWRERTTKRVLAIQQRMDIALFGVGSPFSEVPSHVYAGGYLDEADYAILDASHVVGDIATVFYRIDGSSDGIPLNDRSTGPDPAVMHAVARRICVVSGSSKITALRGALAAGMITDLVIDEPAARALLTADTAERLRTSRE
ncbi:DNA-binding transcriptional regulator LsrR (DeoR family) [Conyzicola lurida]|uniref:DNA-binding transcriptional regulator LsrR (DeoR family) n=2 Tax=Conyzicola lurida TaxID=1172621 RepID=A0A841APQ6_9MICO|nr:DNA-binding transcriptional regulator LsrR (DeoR family) [Conyzicola lurida]